MFTCDLVEYNFKDVYKTFNISYLSKNDDLLNQFVDNSDLKNYESVEESTNKIIKILIKKFKLRISFHKSLNFSNDIVISDDYEFNLNTLNHSDSLIKIAIVEDNCEKWVNSEYLCQYDYIFTLKEYYEELNKINKTFLIKGESIYEQIKHILNELYRRKTNKFYFLVKDLNLENVFPKWNNYFIILDSELFDEQWYREKYNVPDNTDCVTHFLLIGCDKGYDPGPDFNTSGYLEYYEDVKRSRKNPLVHYELFGMNEGRRTKYFDIPEEFYSVILNSPLFNEEWYRSTYDIPDDVDAISHFINVGHNEGYDPGPDFSTNEYLECNIDVKNNGINSLIHYEQYGKDEGRAIRVSDVPQRDYSFIMNSPLFDEDWYRRTYDIPDDVDAINHYLNVGHDEGYDPGPNFSTNKYWECNSDVKDWNMNALVHYEFHGRNEKREINISDKSL